MPCKKHSGTKLAIIALIPLARSQFISSLPQCVQDCIDSSQDDNCAVTNIGCLCRASVGNFLPDLITCMHGNCDNDLDNSLLLTPLQWACELAGAPIPESALRNAENEASSLAAQATMTVTVGISSSSAQTTTTVNAGSVTSITTTTTESGGSTILEVYPVTEYSTATVFGTPSTNTSVPTSKTSTKASGSSSVSSSESATSASIFSSTIVTSSVTAEKTSSGGTQSKTSEAPNPVDTNSSPFQDANAGAKTPVGKLLGLTIALALGCIWF